MAPIDTFIQDTIQILRDPAWQGTGVIMSSILSIIALHYARQPHIPHPPRLAFKKI